MNNRIAVLCFKITLFFMALTGAAQMPIFKRYYIADLPGLGWLADFYLTNKLHYIFAAVLLYLSFYLAVGFIVRNRGVSRLTSSGMWRGLLYLAVFITGGLRVLKNLPDVTFDPFFVMFFDWTHLGSAILLGIVSMVFFFSGKGSYEAPARNISAGNSDPAG